MGFQSAMQGGGDGGSSLSFAFVGAEGCACFSAILTGGVVFPALAVVGALLGWLEHGLARRPNEVPSPTASSAASGSVLSEPEA